MPVSIPSPEADPPVNVPVAIDAPEKDAELRVMPDPRIVFASVLASEVDVTLNPSAVCTVKHRPMETIATGRINGFIRSYGVDLSMFYVL
jgi:hypothetical protein